MNVKVTEKDRSILHLQSTTQLLPAKTNLDLSPELHPSWNIPVGGRGPKYLSPHVLAPRVCINRKLDHKGRWDFIPGTKICSSGVPSGSLVHCIKKAYSGLGKVFIQAIYYFTK